MSNQQANRYLLISPDYPPPLVGGSLVWLHNLVENCPENFDILTAALKEGEKEVTDSRHRVFRSRLVVDSHDPPRVRLAVTYLYMVLWLALRSRKVRYRAVLVNPGCIGNSLLILLGRLLRINVIGVGHGEEITVALYGKGLKAFVKRNLMGFAYKKAAGFFVVCHFCRDLIVGMGGDADTIEVIPSCLNPNKRLPIKESQARGFRILSVGRLIERKGFHCLIDAVQKVKKEVPQVELHIVGEGPFRRVLDEKVRRNDLESYVHLRGRISDEELSKLYQTSDVFVLAHMMLENGDTEGCPTVFSEASGAGLPVIGGTGAGASTVIVEGETGFIVNARDTDVLAEKIKFLLQNPEVAREMGREGIKKIQRDHNPEINGRRLGEFILRYA